MKGTYCLIIKNKKQCKINIGAIGPINFKEGFYIYIGSAMNSLIPRIKRHLSDNKKIHWHVDYLLKNKNTQIEEVIFNIDEKKIECYLANSISNDIDAESIANFGCSDCNCNSHLIYFENNEKCLKSIEKAYNNLNIQYYDLNYFYTLE